MLLSLYSKNFIYLALALTANVQLVSGQNSNQTLVSNRDFVELKGKIQEYIAQNPDRRIPLLVRNSFHDLFLQEKGAMRGCIVKDDFKNDVENAGLAPTIEDLQNIVSQNFPNTGFLIGDVIAFAGKIAVETAYPCINIKFKFNRAQCTQASAITANQAPSAFIETIDGLGGMFDYLGGSITPEDMAILFAGAHGIKGARADPSGWRGVFSTFSSGKAFIAKTFSDTWKFVANDQTLAQFFTGGTFNPQSSTIRLPTDMIFYPSKVPNGSNKDDSAEARAIETKLKDFTTKDRNEFDQAFARAFEKLIAIGNGNEDFVETVSTEACPESPNPPPQTTSTASPPQTTVSQTATSSGPETTTVTEPETSATSTKTICTIETTATITDYLYDDVVISDADISYPAILIQLFIPFLFI